MTDVKLTKAALPLVALWTENNLRARPKEGSVLAKIVDSQFLQDTKSYVYLANEKETIIEDREERLNELADLISGSNISSVDGDIVSEEAGNELLDEIYETLGDLVCDHVGMIQNHIKPLIIDLAERIKTTVESAELSDFLNVKIRKLVTPKSFRDGRFTNSLKNYHAENHEMQVKLELPKLEWSDVLTLLNSGFGEIDEENIRFINEAGSTRIMSMVDKVFWKDCPEKTYSIENYLKDREFAPHYTLVLYLLATNLYNKPMEGTNQGLNDFNNNIIHLREVAGWRLNQIIRSHLANVEDKILVKSYGDNFVEVYDDVYEDFLEDGGKPEIVLGMLFSSTKHYSYSNLLSRANELERLWHNYTESAKLNNETNLSNLIYRAAVEEFHDQLKNDPAYSEARTYDISLVVNEARKVLDEVPKYLLKDVTEVALRIICRARFPHTPAEEFLRDFNEIANGVKSEDNIEAAEIGAITRYINRFVCSLISVDVC